MARYEIIVFAALVAALMVALLPLIVTAYIRVRRKADVARSGFFVFKISLVTFLISAILYTVEYAYRIILESPVYNYSSSRTAIYYNYWEVVWRAHDFAYFFLNTSYSLIMIAEVEIGMGILHCLGLGLGARKFVNWTASFLGGLTIGFAFILLVRHEIYTTLYMEYARDDDSIYAPIFDYQTHVNLNAALDFILWLATIAAQVLAVIVVVQARKWPGFRQTAIFYAIAVLWSLLGTTWAVGFTIAWILPGEDIPPLSIYLIVYVVFTFWSAFFALFFLFLVGNKRTNGVWSAAPAYGPGEPYVVYNQPAGHPQQPGVQWYHSNQYAPPGDAGANFNTYGQYQQHQMVALQPGAQQQPHQVVGYGPVAKPEPATPGAELASPASGEPGQTQKTQTVYQQAGA